MFSCLNKLRIQKILKKKLFSNDFYYFEYVDVLVNQAIYYQVIQEAGFKYFLFSFSQINKLNKLEKCTTLVKYLQTLSILVDLPKSKIKKFRENSAVISEMYCKCNCIMNVIII